MIEEKIKALESSEQKYRNFIETIRNGWAYHKIVVDEKNNPIDYIFLEINHAFEIQTGLKREDILGKKISEILPDTQQDPADWIGKYGKVALSGESITFENYSASIEKWFTVTASAPEKGYFITVFEEIGERKKIEAEKEALIVKLQKALSEIKILSGFLPICSSCHKIRDDQGYWNRIEAYISSHSEVQFSHGICPDCDKKLYPELFNKDKSFS